jgi:hypothetical protein
LELAYTTVQNFDSFNTYDNWRLIGPLDGDFSTLRNPGQLDT